jgi:hypothetical protein
VAATDHNHHTEGQTMGEHITRQDRWHCLSAMVAEERDRLTARVLNKTQRGSAAVSSRA